MSRKYTNEMVNRDTGEIVPVQVLQRKRVDWAFIQVKLEANLMLAGSDTMTLGAFKVLHWLMGSVNHDCLVVTTQGRIATATKLSRQSVNAAVKLLVAEKLITVLGGHFSLNKDYMRRGGK